MPGNGSQRHTPLLGGQGPHPRHQRALPQQRCPTQNSDPHRLQRAAMQAQHNPPSPQRQAHRKEAQQPPRKLDGQQGPAAKPERFAPGPDRQPGQQSDPQPVAPLQRPPAHAGDPSHSQHQLEYAELIGHVERIFKWKIQIDDCVPVPQIFWNEHLDRCGEGILAQEPTLCQKGDPEKGAEPHGSPQRCQGPPQTGSRTPLLPPQHQQIAGQQRRKQDQRHGMGDRKGTQQGSQRGRRDRRTIGTHHQPPRSPQNPGEQRLRADLGDRAANIDVGKQIRGIQIGDGGNQARTPPHVPVQRAGQPVHAQRARQHAERKDPSHGSGQRHPQQMQASHQIVGRRRIVAQHRIPQPRYKFGHPTRVEEPLLPMVDQQGDPHQMGRPIRRGSQPQSPQRPKRRQAEKRQPPPGVAPEPTQHRTPPVGVAGLHHRLVGERKLRPVFTSDICRSAPCIDTLLLVEVLEKPQTSQEKMLMRTIVPRKEESGFLHPPG